MARSSPRWPLLLQILGLALLNLVVIVALLVAFAQWQFGLSVEAIALGPSRDRIVALANQFARDLNASPYDSRNAVLADYSRRYAVDVLIVDPRGQSLSSVPVRLPRKLLDRMRLPPARGIIGSPGRRPPLGGGFDPPEKAGSPPFESPPPDDPGGPRPGERGFIPLGGVPSDVVFLTITRNPLQYWVGVRIPTTGPQGERGVPGVLLLRTDSILNRSLFFAWRALLWLGTSLGVTALLCWLPFVYGLTKTVHRMGSATEKIAMGRFDRPLDIRRADELGHLAGQINRMAAQLESFVKHQKRFLGDIAHELCAPLARIQFALGILEHRAGDEQQPYVGVLHDEIQEMSEMINELLMFSKAGMQTTEATLTYMELAPVVRDAISRQVLGFGTIEVSLPPGIGVIAHKPYLLRAVSNLLRNALRYAGADGPIVVSAQRQGGRVLLKVADSGPGLPEEELEHVFAPFYRPEAARGRDTGGVGLGLAIVKSCIEACRGTVSCRNRQPLGLEVTITLSAENRTS